MAKKAAPKAAESKPAPAAPAEKPAAKAAAKAITKAEIYTHLSEKSGLTKKQVASIFEALGGAVGSALGKKGSGLFVIPGMVKLKVVRKPATKAKQGINPFTKQPLTIKAKPARNVVKAVPLKALKDLV
jgi:nucleoid DNA-binding protein